MMTALPMDLLKRLAEAPAAIYAGVKYLLGMPLEPEELKAAKAGLRATLAGGGSATGNRVTLPPFTVTETGPAGVPVVVHLGRFRYRPGFNRVRIGKTIYDLRRRQLARLCLELMIRRQAFDAGSALHFRTEIDPQVRRIGDLGEAGTHSEPKIDQYFNDAENHLAQLRSELIAVDHGTGNYFLKATAGCIVEFDFISP